MTADRAFRNRLRRMAGRQALHLEANRRRDRFAANYGLWRLRDAEGQVVARFTSAEVEDMAEALTGAAIERLPEWYQKRQAAREPSGGRHVTTEANYYPDKTAEAIRCDICEGANHPDRRTWSRREPHDGQSARHADFDLTHVADPQAWLTDNLGPLVHYTVIERPQPKPVRQPPAASPGPLPAEQPSAGPEPASVPADTLSVPRRGW